MDLLRKVQADLDELAKNLEGQVMRTDSSIEEAAKTWRDERFIEFKSKFGEDKELMYPLISSVREFNDGFLQDTINRLDAYLYR